MNERERKADIARALKAIRAVNSAWGVVRTVTQQADRPYTKEILAGLSEADRQAFEDILSQLGDGKRERATGPQSDAITITPIRMDVADPDRAAEHQLQFEIRSHLSKGDVELTVCTSGRSGRDLHSWLIRATDALELLEFLQQLTEQETAR